ncbi:7-dehydrocholesterol reductase [Fusarium subglutinans]|uniref:Delta(24)-sterol reductase n=1 Tax=Gibberella subglutinans TaxID=42677 RepID=A0A8H5PUX2_GIBSU|nr:7-dehydrocholesterol reductase [Fusarium subglutinans]KAF5602676.1 7-dehydrocholesterol reductase [Fusarium subglutinans]
MSRIAEGLPMAGSTTTITTQRKKKPTEAKALTTEVQMLAGADVWGRAAFGRSWLRSLVGASPLFLAPMASISIFITLAEYEGSLSLFADAVKEHGFWTICAQYGPHLTTKGIAAVICWVGIQALLYCLLPGEQHQGQLTPAGYLLSYKINGLSAWIVTHLLYALLSWLGILDPGFIPRNWSSLIGAMNLAGFVISALALVKAYVMPTHPEDRKFSGSFLYDFFMGIELNPRLGENFDLKLFSNGRAGMMVWTLIDFSNMAYQYQNQGFVEPSLILVTALQTIYVVDFFVNESWYLRTIDVKFDHYGFYLSWGCFCFLPTTYTIQGQYLGRYPSSASTPYLAFFFALGVAGYILFRSVNHQKEIVRRTGGKCTIWGKPAECIVASFRTSDGRQHRSLLLCSGWWGWSRHANYLGDLILSFSSCALVGNVYLGDLFLAFDIADKIRDFYKLRQPYRVSHGASSSTRPRHGSDTNVVDISMLSQVITVDSAQRTCLVEPNVPMDRLIAATMPYGLIPPVVMEFPGITAGGGFAGTSGESSSFRHGFFNETIDFVEMILGNGDIIRALRQEHEDLFYGAAGAAGTLGLTTLMQVRLVEAKQFVKTMYHRVDSVTSAISTTKQCCEKVGIDYVDGILYSKDHGVVITGEMTNTKPSDSPVRTFSNSGDHWFYLHVKEQTESLPPSATVTEYIPLGEYLFRYDRAAFWVGRQGYTYFKFVPFNEFFRWLFDDYSHTRTLYHALHASRISDQFVVQDLALPYDTAEAFVDWVDAELGIWPLWLCPLKGCRTPTFHPVTKGSSDTGAGNDISQPMLNIGVWGWGPSDREEFKVKNQALEKKLRELGGRKWLYAHTYYTEEQFWDLYDWSWYERLRERYFATTLPTVYDKVKKSGPDTDGRHENGWGLGSLLNKWPVGGIYGMILAFYSGDINLHRRAKWSYVIYNYFLINWAAEMLPHSNADMQINILADDDVHEDDVSVIKAL